MSKKLGNPTIIDIAYGLLSNKNDTASFTLKFDNRYKVDVDVSLLRVEDTETGDVEFYDPVMRYTAHQLTTIH